MAEFEGKKFAVVTFPEEDNDVSVVPLNWIFDNGKKCYFPNSVSEQRKNFLIKTQAPMKKGWKDYDIKIFKCYTSYETAVDNTGVAEYTSHLESEQDTGGHEEVPTKRRKITKKTALLGEEGYCREYSSEESDEDNANNTNNTVSPLPFPTAPKQTPRSTKTNLHFRYQAKLGASPNHSDSSSLLGDVDSNGEDNPRWNCQEEQFRPSPTPRRSIIGRNLSSPSSSSSSPKSSDYAQLKANQEIFWSVLEQYQETTTRLEKKIDKAMLLLESMAGGQTSNKKTHEKASSSFAGLPVGNMADFESFEKQLQEDASYKQRLEKLCCSVMGKDARATAASTMRKLISDDVAESYSLTGKPHPGAATKKPFIKTHSFRLVFETCMRCHGECKEGVVRQAVSDWLMQAKFRKGRREKKLAIDNRQEALMNEGQQHTDTINVDGENNDE